MIARRRAQGFDGIAVGGAGPQVNLDWTGSGDDTHAGYAVGTRPTVVVATFDKDGTASFVNGCEESSVQGHLENALATMIGARADPASEYGRFFTGTIHELQVFNRTLSASKVIALSARLGESWNVSAKDSKCDANRPKPGTKPTHHCTGQATTLAGAGPSTAIIAQLRKFVVAASAPPLHVSATLIFLTCQNSNRVYIICWLAHDF